MKASTQIATGNGYAMVCSFSRRYRYMGIFFEFHTICGYTPLRKNGELSNTTPKGFWAMIKKFEKLSNEDRKKYEVSV